MTLRSGGTTFDQLADDTAPSISDRVHVAQLLDRANAQAADVVNDAAREAERIRHEAFILLEEARAERDQSSRMRREAASELDATDRMVAATLSEAQQEADRVIRRAREQAWLEAHMIVASARSQARLLNEDAEIFSWES